jgi:hypothetical protein
VLGTALVVILAVAPAAWADPGAAEDAAPPAEAGDPQGAAPGDVPGDSAAAPGNDEHPGNSGDAPGQQGEPGNSGDAPGRQDDQGSAAQTEQGVSVGQNAGASAAADQDDVDNTAATVRVDQPGNGNKVGQENRAAADASASTASAVDGAGDATVVQSASADASATQSDVANTSIVVRVGSSGDDEGVSQANIATGAAAATTLSDQPALASADATSLAAQDGAANTTVSVRVFSPGDDGPVTQLNTVAAKADASPGGTANAVAQQDAAQNTAVSIRVESPGSVATPVQESHSTSSDDSTGGVAVAIAGDGTNTVLNVAVGGTGLARPGSAGAEVWVWTWVWMRDETQELGDLTTLDPDSWSWSWDGAATDAATRHGNVTSRAADGDEQGREGSLEWTWGWTRAGIPGWTWDWSRQLTLSCSSCIWIWNWSWSWTGQPASGQQGAGATAEPTPPVQLNTATAQATATASATVVQTVLQDGSGASTQFAGQLATVTQEAGATAAARQTGVSGVAWNGDVGQSNTVVSVADTTLAGTLAQRIGQRVADAGAAQTDQWGGQQAELAQLGGAEATSTQRDVALTRAGVHAVSGLATTDESAGIVQTLRQDGRSVGGAASQWAGQLALVEQATNASTTVEQAGSTRSKGSGGTATGSARAAALAVVAQAAEQSTARTAGVGTQTAEQDAFVGQEASARASTDQQVGTAATQDARSGAVALTRAEILQDAAQSARGSSLVLQDILQRAIVVQRAEASSLSSGGIAGTAFVLDCALVQQGATQSIATDPARPRAAADTTFCLPEAAPPTSPPVVPGSPTAPGGELATIAAATESVAPVDTLVRPVARATAAASPRAAAHHTHRNSSAPSALAPAGPVPGTSELSAPPSPQARIDTRPASHAGAGDAGREPPLPPAGDPPNWVSALAAAVSGGGASGIAAILCAFTLAAPLLLRVPAGSAVRRPADVLSRIDVPV